jgi:hypothetical protein
MMVVLGFSHRDVEAAGGLLRWIGELDSTMTLCHELVLLSSSMVKAEDQAAMDMLGRSVFPLTTSRHQIVADERNLITAPKALFRIALLEISKPHPVPFLWLEADCVPMCPDWLDKIEAAYQLCGKPFMGTIYPHPRPHFNGCCIYPPCALRYNPFLVGESGYTFDNDHPELTMRHGHNTPLIQRMFADPVTITPMTFPDQDSLKVISPECVLFHGCKDGSLIARLREKREPKPALKPKSASALIADGKAVRRALAGIGRLRENSPRLAVPCTIFHAVERHEGMDERKMRAQSSWDRLYFQGVLPCHFWRYPRTAREIGDPRALPYLKDVLEFAMRQAGDNDIIMWTNDDDWLHPELPELLKAHVTDHGPCCSKRCDVATPIASEVLPLDDYVKRSFPHMGRDMFAFTKLWLKKYWQEIPDFILGASDFDIALAAIIRLRNGVKTTYESLYDTLLPSEIPDGYVVHEGHVAAWLAPENIKAAASQKHNRRLFREWAKANLPALKFSEYNTIRSSESK